MDKMIIYIHGFGGSGKGTKATLFREFFGNKKRKYLAPSLSYVPDLAISTLEEIIQNCNTKDVRLIGSSLGGFYAIYLSQKFNIKSVLINPATTVTKTLKSITQNEKRALNYFDLSYFEFNENHLKMLEKYKIKKEELRLQNFLVMLQKDDDVIEYQVAKELFNGAKMIITSGGGHSFNGIEEYFEEIDNFLA
jgi:predicted esterase YcpF (UPF0227 family)